MPLLKNLIGQVLDAKYRIDKQLGQGGMGAVYLATHVGTERPVALKVIVPEYMAETEFVERFKREAKAAGRLRHPNVVNVTDFGFTQLGTDHLAYLVMEYLDGNTLASFLIQTPTPPLAFIVDIVEQTCLAIDTAHKQGIIHRDLKPDNIWLQPNGRGSYNVKVLDFGLAKLYAPNSTEDKATQTTNAAIIFEAETQIANPKNTGNIITEKINSSASIIDAPAPINSLPISTPTPDLVPLSLVETAVNILANPYNNNEQPTVDASLDNQATIIASASAAPSNELTQVGVVLGTPSYMSPEQCAGKMLDTRSDIYSLGVIVYEMLAGQKPFNGNLRALINQHITTPPPPLIPADHKIPTAVIELVMSALAKNPAARPSTAGAFATALRIKSEGELPLLRTAFDLYRNHFLLFLRLSACLYLPYFLLNYLLVAISLSKPFPTLSLAFTPVLNQWYWLFSLAIIIFANTINSGAFAPSVAQLRNRSQTKLRLKETLHTFFTHLPTLLAATVRGSIDIVKNLFKFVLPGLKTYIDYSLYAPIVILENRSAEMALTRSRTLVAGLPSAMAALQVRNTFLSAMIVLISPIIFVLCSLISAIVGEGVVEIAIPRTQALPAFIFIPTTYTLISWSILILLYPLIAIALNLFYFNARAARGETLPSSEISPTINSTQSRNSRTRMAILIATLLITTIGWWAIKDTLLVLATVGGFTSMVEGLVIVGANANTKTKRELAVMFETVPLIHAVSLVAEGNSDDTLLTLLLDNGADVNATNAYRWTALLEAVSQDRLALVKLLVERGADVNAAQNQGETPLMTAVSRGNKEIVTYLLAQGADVNRKNEEGKTALILAIERGQAYVVAPLLIKAEVNLADNNGHTALMQAAIGGDSYLVKELLNAGADPQLKDARGKTAANYAEQYNHQEIINLFTD